MAAATGRGTGSEEETQQGQCPAGRSVGALGGSLPCGDSAAEFLEGMLGNPTRLSSLWRAALLRPSERHAYPGHRSLVTVRGLNGTEPYRPLWVHVSSPFQVFSLLHILLLLQVHHGLPCWLFHSPALHRIFTQSSCLLHPSVSLSVLLLPESLPSASPPRRPHLYLSSSSL